MGTRKDLELFCRRWAPTVLSFTTLFLGNDDAAVEAAVEALAGYMNTGQKLEMDEFPLPLWECVVGRVRAATSKATRETSSLFDDAILELDEDARLVFLLDDVFAVPMSWIVLITKWPEERVAFLGASATARMKTCLGHPGELMISSFSKRDLKWSTEMECGDADDFQPARRNTVN